MAWELQIPLELKKHHARGEGEVGHGGGLKALEWAHGHVGGDGRPQGEGGDGHGDEVGHGGGLEALEWAHGHVGGDV